MGRAALRVASVLFVLLGVTATAWAHKPVVVDNSTPTGPDNAYVLEDVLVSQVGYHEVTAEAPSFWFTFTGVAGQEVQLQAGVPFIERFSTLRPIVALVGPSLPDASLPFEIPAGDGALIFDTRATTPTVFSEPFTGTRSWQFEPQQIVLPADGTYFAVAYLPPGTYGKIWLTTGTIESFDFADVIGLPGVSFQVRRFHEVFPVGGIVGWLSAFLLALLFSLFVRLF